MKSSKAPRPYGSNDFSIARNEAYATRLVFGGFDRRLFRCYSQFRGLASMINKYLRNYVICNPLWL